MNSLRTSALVAVVLAIGFTIPNASDEVTDNYACVLEGAQVVPPNGWVPVGNGMFHLNAVNELAYDIIECFGLNRAEVHIHGPAGVGENGPIIFTIPVPPNNPAYWSGVLGPLTTQQLRDLNCGLWYLDIHTPEFPEGQVRGRVRGLWGWQPAWPCFLPTRQSTWGAIKALYR
jgi:CHRD domain